MNDERNYLSTCEAAEYLGLSARTLRRYRVTGDGPVFHRFGARVRYRREDLDAWAAARRRLSTVDDGSALPAPRVPVSRAPGSRAKAGRRERRRAETRADDPGAAR